MKTRYLRYKKLTEKLGVYIVRFLSLFDHRRIQKHKQSISSNLLQDQTLSIFQKMFVNEKLKNDEIVTDENI